MTPSEHHSPWLNQEPSFIWNNDVKQSKAYSRQIYSAAVASWALQTSCCWLHLWYDGKAKWEFQNYISHGMLKCIPDAASEKDILKALIPCGLGRASQLKKLVPVLVRQAGNDFAWRRLVARKKSWSSNGDGVQYLGVSSCRGGGSVKFRSMFSCCYAVAVLSLEYWHSSSSYYREDHYMRLQSASICVLFLQWNDCAREEEVKSSCSDPF